MSHVAQQIFLWGKHASRSSFLDTPALLLPLDWGPGTSFPHTQGKLDRGINRGNAQQQAMGIGPKTQAISMGLEVSGTKTADGTSPTPLSTESETALLKDLIYGADGDAGGGTLTTTAAAGHTPATGILELTAGDGAQWQVGDAIMFRGGVTLPDGTINYVSRFITAIAVDTLTLSHPYTQTPPSTDNVFPGIRHRLNKLEKNPVHAYFEVEGAFNDAGAARLFRREFYGCACSKMTYTLPPGGGLVRVQFDFRASNWERDVLQNLAAQTPDKGSEIPFSYSPILIDDVELCVQSLTFEVEVTLTERGCPGEANGNRGFTADARIARMSFEAFFGELTGEVDDTTSTPDLEALEGRGTHDVLLQLGNEPGAGEAIWLPALDMTAELVDSGGRRMIRASGMDTESPVEATIPGSVQHAQF